MTDAADPVGDQIKAAAEDAERRFTSAVKSLGVSDPAQGNPGEVVAEVVTKYMKSIRSGNGQKCEHIVGGPQVIFGAACVPGVVGCAKCVSTLAEFKHKIDATTGVGRVCDGCQHHAPWGHTGMVQNGPLLLTVNLCNDCMTRDNENPLSDEDAKGYW